ncbi:hypothetical protein MN608_06097 [Microdochium nivale]|nr:hypothetical protein MN608_06097 [Microdochium nivale]
MAHSSWSGQRFVLHGIPFPNIGALGRLLSACWASQGLELSEIGHYRVPLFLLARDSRRRFWTNRDCGRFQKLLLPASVCQSPKQQPSNVGLQTWDDEGCDST